MKGIQKMNAAVEKVLNIMVAVSFNLFIAACVLQVFTRFVLNNSLSWTEELARYAFIWSNLLGAAICTQKSSHATVTAITDALPKKVQTVLKIAVNLIIILVAYVLVRYGWKVVMSTRMQLSPALRISMSYVYASAPVCGVLVIFYSAVHLAESLAELAGKGERL